MPDNRCKVVSLMAALALGAVAGCGSGGGGGAPTTSQGLDQEMNAAIKSAQNDPKVPPDKKAGLVEQIKRDYAQRKAQEAAAK